MGKAIYFDMDGTIADLYGADNWLPRLRAEDETLFSHCEPLVDMKQFNVLCLALASAGYQLGVISHLPWGASTEYERLVTQQKIDWIEVYAPLLLDNMYCQPYGTPKHYAPRRQHKSMVLVDDNADVLSVWQTAVQRIGIKVENGNTIEAVSDRLLV